MASALSPRLVLIAIVVLAAALIPVVPSYAQAECPPGALCLPAGLACPDFDLQIQFAGGDHRVFRTFYDKSGDPVRALDAGRGYELIYTNLASGTTLTTPPNGSVGHTTFNADGSQSVFVTGHTVLIFFPTDVPAGPTTTLYVGRVEYTIGADGVWTLGKVSGQQTDICAALAR